MSLLVRLTIVLRMGKARSRIRAPIALSSVATIISKALTTSYLWVVSPARASSRLYKIFGVVTTILRLSVSLPISSRVWARASRYIFSLYRWNCSSSRVVLSLFMREYCLGMLGYLGIQEQPEKQQQQKVVQQRHQLVVENIDTSRLKSDSPMCNPFTLNCLFSLCRSSKAFFRSLYSDRNFRYLDLKAVQLSSCTTHTLVESIFFWRQALLICKDSMSLLAEKSSSRIDESCVSRMISIYDLDYLSLVLTCQSWLSRWFSRRVWMFFVSEVNCTFQRKATFFNRACLS